MADETSSSSHLGTADQPLRAEDPGVSSSKVVEQPHPKTGIPELDKMRPISLYYSYNTPQITPKPYFGHFSVISFDEETNTAVLSPIGDFDCQELTVSIDQDDFNVAEILDKSQGNERRISILKKFRDDGSPYFAIFKAEPLDSTEFKAVIQKPNDKPQVAKVSYDKYINKALGKHQTIVADMVAQRVFLGMCSLSKEETENLLRRVNTLTAFKNFPRQGNLSALYQDIPVQKFDNYFTQYIQGKSFKELLECKLPKPVTYTDKDENGNPVERTITSLGQNLRFNDDKQNIPPDLWEKIKKDETLLLAYAANRAVLRSISNGVANLGANLSPREDVNSNQVKIKLLDYIENGPKGKPDGNDFISLENKNFALDGVLFTPYRNTDPIIPGQKPEPAAIHSVELLQQSLDRTLTEGAIRSDATIFNQDKIIDGVAKKIDFSRAGSPEEASRLRYSQLGNQEYPNSVNTLKDKVNDLLREMGLTEFDPKAAMTAWAAAIGTAIKGIQEHMESFEVVGLF